MVNAIEETDWSEVPDVLREYVIVTLQKERAKLVHKEAEISVTNRIMIDSMKQSMKSAIAASGLDDAQMGDMLSTMGGGMAKSAEAVLVAKLAAIDAAIATLSRGPVS